MVSIAPALLPVAALVLGATALSPLDSPAAMSTAPAPTPAPRTSADTHAAALPRAEPSPRALRKGWQWPLLPAPTVTRRFQRPASTWGPGHRGIDLAATPGQHVLAAAAGRVTHVGVIAGRGTVSVTHLGGVRTTYEPVTPLVRRGDMVRAGQVIGVVSGHRASHCAGCLHFGALRGRIYLDPLALLKPGRVVLLPLGGGL